MRSDSVISTFKTLFSKELKDESEKSKIIKKVKEILIERVNQLKGKIYTSMFNSSVDFSKDQTHYVSALQNSIFLLKKQTIVAPSLKHLQSQPSACINTTEEFRQSLEEKRDNDSKWGNERF